MKKTTVRNKLDKVVSKIVRARGKCQNCGSIKSLQAAHIFSRIYNNTRWDLDNLLCLCASCHFFFHKNPLEFAHFVGEEKYQLLKEARNQITKYSTADLELKFKVLEDIWKTLSASAVVLPPDK
jgi:hypothetical protein